MHEWIYVANVCNKILLEVMVRSQRSENLARIPYQLGASVNMLTAVLAIGGVVTFGTLPGIVVNGERSADGDCINDATVVLNARQRLRLLDKQIGRLESGQSADECDPDQEGDGSDR